MLIPSQIEVLILLFLNNPSVELLCLLCIGFEAVLGFEWYCTVCVLQHLNVVENMCDMYCVKCITYNGICC